MEENGVGHLLTVGHSQSQDMGLHVSLFCSRVVSNVLLDVVVDRHGHGLFLIAGGHVTLGCWEIKINPNCGRVKMMVILLMPPPLWVCNEQCPCVLVGYLAVRSAIFTWHWGPDHVVSLRVYLPSAMTAGQRYPFWL